MRRDNARMQHVKQTGAKYALLSLVVLVVALIYVEYRSMYERLDQQQPRSDLDACISQVQWEALLVRESLLLPHSSSAGLISAQTLLSGHSYVHHTMIRLGYGQEVGYTILHQLAYPWACAGLHAAAVHLC